jgi:hypothetical protein
MSLIMTFMLEPAKLQMNWAKASGISIWRSDAAVGPRPFPADVSVTAPGCLIRLRRVATHLG